jgi:hypothetical protein
MGSREGIIWPVPPLLGPLLGAANAEADDVMLRQAFLQTPDYLTLLHSTDFNYVVGRRGTGKSALFLGLRDKFAEDSGVILLTEQPNDYEMVELQALLRSLSTEYRVLRPITRLLWGIHLLIETARVASKNYRFTKALHFAYLTEFLEKHSISQTETGAAQCVRRLKAIIASGPTPEEIPARLAAEFQFGVLKEAVREVLNETRLTVVALYDRLDEAWLPETPAIAILGGLARAVAEGRESKFPIYPVLFVRDNMFRALAHEDDDFTRHIEGHTLRLQWDEESLFGLVVARLRIVLQMQTSENDVKVWNRFAHRELQGREGFAKCLRLTLYRPRDIVVLLNQAYLNARRDSRNEIIASDVDKTALDISQHRLDDLFKEYDGVLPGLKTFVNAFKRQPVRRTFAAATDDLNQLVAESTYSQPSDRELTLFDTGGDMFAALYSVGFIGLQEEASQSFTFCHDGTMSTLVAVPANRQTLVHPCYWKALDGSIADEDEITAIHVNDEYAVPPTGPAIDVRLQRLGRMPEELSGIPSGHSGSGKFEGWVLRAVRLLLSGQLTNIDIKPNPNAALSQRDVVGTNATISSLWKRIYEQYGTLQVIFECKNYDEVTADDFRQVLDYTHGDYGRCAFIVRRGPSDQLTLNEQDRIRAMFYEHERLIVVVPTNLLVLCIRKMRKTRRYDYTEFTLAKHVDHIVRSVLSMTHGPRFRIKRKKPSSN